MHEKKSWTYMEANTLEIAFRQSPKMANTEA